MNVNSNQKVLNQKGFDEKALNYLGKKGYTIYKINLNQKQIAQVHLQH